MNTIIIADDERIIRIGLKKIINQRIPELEIIGEAENGEACLEMIRLLKPDIVVTDIRMPYMDGLKMMEIIREMDKRTRFVILSGYDDFNYCRKALKLDAFEYLLKPVDENELVFVLNRLVQDISMNNHGRETPNSENSDNRTGNDLPVVEKKTIREIKEYIRNNYMNYISLESLSKEFYLNPKYISQLFKKEMNINFSDYLTEIRIEKSKILLKDRSLKIGEVSEMAGFGNAKHFSKTFKRLTGFTPSQYKESV